MTVTEPRREPTYPQGDDLALEELRAEYPHVGLLHLVEHHGVALWGRSGYLEAASEPELRALLKAS